MKVAITGHRPNKITDSVKVRNWLAEAFEENGVDYIISGMAAGVDLWAVQVAHRHNIGWICAKPWKTHISRIQDRALYTHALDGAAEIVDVTDYDTYPGPLVYQRRNEWMVDNSTAVVAVWDGTSGGTANCVAYARKKERPIWLIHPTLGPRGWWEC